jgi:UDP-N-acetylmuramoyl-tripeptide--D-alanyl-D-alanine ligase
VTAVRGVHLSRAGSLAAIARGKRELVEALPASGAAVLNADDPLVAGMAAQTRARVLTYGFDSRADVGADEVVSDAAAGMHFRLRLPTGIADVRTPALGRHSVHNALAAAAVGFAAGLDTPTIVSGLGRGFRAPHRTQLIGTGRWRVLDDSYNASPDSMAAALNLLGTLPGRHVAVLGAMLELGDASDAAHRLVGACAASHADRLIVIGPDAALIADGALQAGMAPGNVTGVENRDAALEVLLADVRPDDTILVKASRGAELDLLVGALVHAARDGAAA